MKARFHPFSDLLLERYLAGELEAAEARRIEEAAAQRPDLDEYLRGRRADREAFKLRRPPLKLPTSESRPPLMWRWAFAGLALVAATVLALVLLPRDDRGIAMRGDERPTVSVAVQRGVEVFEYRDGVVLQPKDRIRLTVKVPQPGYLTVVDRDARGEPAVLYDSVNVSGETTLPDSLELDDIPGHEELLLFFTAGPLPGAKAIDRARQGATTDATVVKLSKGGP